MKKTKVKKISISIIIVFILMSLSAMLYASTIETTDLVFEDNNLYMTIKNTFSKQIISSDNETKTLKIATDNLNAVTELDLSNSEIVDLTGIEAFSNVTNLNLSKNSITDITPISTLTNLTRLNLSNNKIEDFATISTKNNLVELYLESTGISDVKFLNTLYNLQVLDISNNNISSLQDINSLYKLTKLNVSKNKSLTILDNIVTHTALVDLNISETSITDIELITNLGNLKVLNVGNLTLNSLNPIVDTYKDELTGENIAYLYKLEVLDIRYTKSITFSSLQKLPNLKKLYMQGNNISSLSGIAKLESLEYINLEDNNISNIEAMVQWKTVNNIKYIEYSLKAKEISLKNNNITNIGTFSYLEQDIEYLDLSQNHIYNVNALSGNSFSKGLHLEDQTVDFSVYQKKAEVNQYIILPNILQLSKQEGSIVYAENLTLEAKGVTFNENEPYLTPGYFNIIIDYNKTSKDELYVKINGGVADGTVINYHISTSSSAIDSLLFIDPNLDQAIYEYLLTHKKDSTYLARVPKIINITQSEIAATKVLDLSNHEIRDLTGLASFLNLTDLNLSQNLITTIDELQYCKNMRNLNVCNTSIGNNNAAIEQMEALTTLDISNTGMTNINCINNLVDKWISKKKNIPLIELNISNNGLTDENVAGIEKITNLQKLYIANNKVTDISKLETLVNIDTFNMSGNQISDISILSGLTNLRTLYMSNNKIEDISSIVRIPITVLDFSGNMVKNISSMSRMTSLTDLYMDNNLIEDISPLDSLLINNVFSVKQQKTVKIIDENAQGIVNIELPQLFKAAKQSGSKVYTAFDFSLNNCTLSEDGNSVIINTEELGDKIALITISRGNANGTTLAIAEALKGTIEYNITEKTNQDVTAKIMFNRGNVTITNNNGSSEYKFTQNGEFVFEYMDDYGFEGTTTAIVNWIDKQAPKCTVSKQVVNKNVVITINSDEEIKTLDGWTLSDNKCSITKTFAVDTTTTLQISDIAGNIVNVPIEIKIDTTAPSIVGVANNESYKQAVAPVIQDENLKEIILTKDEVKVENYQSGNVIREKGIYVLTATDAFGNTTTITFQIEELSDIITSNNFEVKEETLQIIGVQPKTTAQMLKNNINNEMEYEIIDEDGNVVSNTSIIGTGYQIKMNNNKKYTVIITGDCDGDGNADIRDILEINKHRLNKASLNGSYFIAGDINNDGKLDIKDILEINKYRLGKIDSL